VTLTGLIITYVIMWWMAFLALLPVGVKGLHENGANADLHPAIEKAAPVRPGLWGKARWAFVISALLTLVLHLAVSNDLAALLPQPPSQRAVAG
jgi:predicted secreted protein